MNAVQSTQPTRYQHKEYTPNPNYDPNNRPVPPPKQHIDNTAALEAKKKIQSQQYCFQFNKPSGCTRTGTCPFMHELMPV